MFLIAKLCRGKPAPGLNWYPDLHLDIRLKGWKNYYNIKNPVGNGCSDS